MIKKGFTLIELLAVIVVLAIVALISVPILIDVIDKVKLGSLKDSAYGLISSAENYYAINSGKINTNVKFTIENNIMTSENKLQYKGNVKNGTIILTTDSKTLICIDKGKNYVLKYSNDKNVTTGAGTCGEYEEESGSFEIVEPTSARIEELEKINSEQANLIQELETTLDQLISKFAVVSYNYSGTPQSYEAPINGTYKIQLWGAQSTGKGAYVSGNIKLKKGDILYIYVGSNGVAFNSGTGTQGGSSSGGATDVRLVDGAWNSIDSLRSRIMVAAVGGGGNYGGAAGGLTGYKAGSANGTDGEHKQHLVVQHILHQALV